MKSVFEKKGLRLPNKCITPLKHGYRPELDCPMVSGNGWFIEVDYRNR